MSPVSFCIFDLILFLEKNVKYYHLYFLVTYITYNISLIQILQFKISYGFINESKFQSKIVVSKKEFFR